MGLQNVAEVCEGMLVLSKNCYSMARRMREDERQERHHLVLSLETQIIM